MEGIETSYWTYALGFLGQGFFGARLVVQLFLSEKAGKVVSPTIFWQLSVGASFLFLIYGVLRNDLIIVVGQTLSYFIYIRNLQLKNYWLSIPASYRWVLLFMPVLLITGWIFTGDITLQSHFSTAQLLHPVMIMGGVGQLMLNLRFVYQWHYSEKYKTSLLPIGFWNISTWSSLLVLIYALWHPLYGIDPVLLVAQGFGTLVYVRNIFIYRKANRQALPAESR